MTSFESMHAHAECPYRAQHSPEERAQLAALEAVGLAPTHYVKGSQVLITDTLTNPLSGTPVTAPSAIGYSVSPNGTKVTYAPAATDANHWQFAISANASGQWNYRMESPPGVGEGAAEGIFFVDPSPF